MSASEDKIFYGGGEAVPIFTPEGMSEIFLSPNVILSNNFELVSARPGELADNQEVTAFLLTFKGVSAKDKGLISVTVVVESPLVVALIKALRAKLAEVPVNFR